jgi:hypothetical protein
VGLVGKRPVMCVDVKDDPDQRQVEEDRWHTDSEEDQRRIDLEKEDRRRADMEEDLGCRPAPVSIVRWVEEEAGPW